MDRYIKYANVVNTTESLEEKENLAVDFAGEIISDIGTGCFGIVKQGRPKGMASVIATSGVTTASVDGGTNISVNDPLTPGGGTPGYLVKATVGTHPIRAYAMETATSVTEIEVYLV